MANRISAGEMEYAGILAKLSLTPEEQKEAGKDLEQMLNYIDKLNELNTEDIEPMFHVFPVCNVFRNDEARPYEGGRNKILENAPEKREGRFVVPKTVE